MMKNNLHYNNICLSLGALRLWTESPAKKAKVPASPFTVKGECDDEVTFKFDDGKELYVSKGFLVYMSPVFKTMFLSEFKEKQTGIVNMPGKQYEDVLKFLLASYPGAVFKINGENVLKLVPLAEEYQVVPLREKCKATIIPALRYISSDSIEDIAGKITRLLTILDVVHLYTDSYKDTIDKALEVITSHNCMCLVQPTTGFSDKEKICKTKFKSLSKDLQLTILEDRIYALEG